MNIGMHLMTDPPWARQKCAGGASPCGFHVHEGAWVPCRNATDSIGPSSTDRPRPWRDTRLEKAPCVPNSGKPASVSFAVARKPTGEWTENYTAPIVGPNEFCVHQAPQVGPSIRPSQSPR